MADYSLAYLITGDASSLVSAAGEGEAALGRLDATGTRTGNTLTTAFGAVAVAGITALGAGLASTISTAATFEQRISSIGAVAGATAQQMDQIRTVALQLGKDTSFSASEAAAGMEELLKAGQPIADVLNGGAEAMLNLAAAGGVSVPQAATIMSTAMNTFKEDGLTAAETANILAGAANASAIDINDLGFSLAAVGPVASVMGVSLHDTATAIAVLGQAGLKGSDAGTSLKTMLLNLSPQTKAASNEMQALGIITGDTAAVTANLTGILQESAAGRAKLTELTKNGAVPSETDLYNAVKKINPEIVAGTTSVTAYGVKIGALQDQFFDATGAIKPMPEIFDILSKAVAGMTKEQEINALKVLFGTDAIRASAIAARLAAGGFDEMSDAMGNVTAADVAAVRLNNLKGSMEKLRGSVETASIMIGSLFLPALKSIVDKTTDVVNDAIPLIEALPDAWRTVGQAFENDWSPSETLSPFINAVGSAAISVHGMVDAVLGLPEPVKAAGLAFATVMVAAGPLATVLGLLPELFGLLLAPIAALLSPIGLLAVGIAGLAAAWTANVGDIQGKTQELLGVVGPAFSQLGGIIATAVSGDITGAFTQFTNLVTTTGQQLGPLLSAWGAQFMAWVPGAITGLETTLRAQVAAIPWGPIWAGAVTAGTALATFLGGLAVDFGTWLSTQVGLIPWQTVWSNAKTAATALGTFLVTQTLDLATWLGAQAAGIPWATVWGNVKDAGSALGSFLVTQTVDFATWLGQQVGAIKWTDVWTTVTGLDTSMQSTFVTAAGTIDWGAVITANAQMASDMTAALGVKFEAAITGVDWTTVGQGLGKGIVDAIAIAFGLAEVSDAWATGFGAAIVRAAPKMWQALVDVLAGVLEGALAEAWNLAITSWAPGAPTLTPPNPAATPGSGNVPGWQVQWPGQGVAPGVQGPPIPSTPATGEPQGPVYGPSIPPGFTPGELTPTPPPVSAAPATPTTAAGSYPPIDNSSRASFARTAWPIFLDAAGGDRNLAQMMIAAAISENKTVGSGQEVGAGNNFFGIKAPGPSTATGSFTSPTWEQGQGATTGEFASFPDPVTGAQGFMQFLRENPRYAPALAAYQQTGNAQQLFQDINTAGYATDPDWGSKIANISRNQVAPNVPSAASGQSAVPSLPAPTAPPSGGLIPRGVANFEQSQQDWDKGFSDANAICGPHLATLFASAVGRPPTREEAVQLAEKMGIYSAAGGGSGIRDASQYDEYASALIQQINPGSPYSVAQTPINGDLGMASQLAQQSLAGGAPIVGFNSGTHYYGATGYNPTAGTFHVGGTGTSLIGGSPDMTIEEINRLGHGITQVITLEGQLQQANAASATSMSAVGTSADGSTQSLSAVGAAIDPVVAWMDQGAVSASQLADAIILSSENQGVAVDSTEAYKAGLTDQQTALEGVLGAFASTTPAAADLLTQLQAGTISTDDAAVAFAGLATTTAESTGAIGDATDTMSQKVITDLSAAQTDGTAALTGLQVDGTAAITGLQTDGTVAADALQVDGTAALQGLQADGTVATQGLQTDGTLATQGLQTDGTVALQALQTDGTVAVQALQTDATTAADGLQTDGTAALVGLQTDGVTAMQGLQADGTTAADTMHSDVVDALTTMSDDATTAVQGMGDDVTSAAQTMADGVTGAVQGMSDQVGGSIDDLSGPLDDLSTGFSDVASAAGDASGPVDDFGSGLGDVASAAKKAAGPVEDFAAAAADIQPPDLGAFIDDLDSVKGAAQKALSAVKALSNQDLSGKTTLGKAEGGPVYHDSMYVVGERGPELFVPFASGVIVPNHKLRGLADGGIVSVGDLGNGLGMYGVAPTVEFGPTASGLYASIIAREDQLISLSASTLSEVTKGATDIAGALEAIDAQVSANGTVEAGILAFLHAATTPTTTPTPRPTPTPTPTVTPTPHPPVEGIVPGGPVRYNEGGGPVETGSPQAGQGVTAPAPPTHGVDTANITRPIAASDAAIQGFVADAVSQATVMQTQSARQAKTMADLVTGNVNRMQDTVADLTAQMQAQAVGAVASMGKGVTNDAGDMSDQTIALSKTMRDGASLAAALMQSNVVESTATMRDHSLDNFSSLASTAADLVGGNRSDSLLTGTYVGTTALDHLLNDPSAGTIYKVRARGIDNFALLAATAGDLIGGNRGDSLLSSVTDSASRLDSRMNDSPSGIMYSVYARSVGHLQNLDTNGSGAAGSAASHIGGSFDTIKGHANSAADDGVDNVGDATDVLASRRPNFSRIINALGDIEDAAKRAGRAISNIPTTSGSSSSSAQAGSEQAPATQREGMIDYDALAAAIVKANADSAHQVNLSLTVEPNIQDFDVVRASVGSQI